MESGDARDVAAAENARIEAAWKEADAALRKSESMKVLYQRATVQEVKLEHRIWKKRERQYTYNEDRVQLSKQIADLESRLKFYLNEKVKYSWNSELRVAQEKQTQGHLEAYAKIACQIACREFFVGPLPRELRDMVYEWMIGDSKVNLDSVLIKQLHSHSSPMRWEDYTFDPWCWSEDFMGPHVFGEYLERWFAVTEFTINMTLSLIPDLVRCPRPTLSIDPAALISRIVVILHYWPNQILPAAVLVEFGHLLKFRNRVHVKLGIHATDRNIRYLNDDYLEEFVGSLGSIFPILRQLKENGSVIEAAINEECYISSENAELSHEEWVKRIKENREFQLATQASDTEDSVSDDDDDNDGDDD